MQIVVPNKPPRFTGSLAFSAVDTPVDDSFRDIGSLNATDPNVDDPVVFRLVRLGEFVPEGAFSVSGDGMIRQQVDLPPGIYRLEVEADDLDGGRTTATVQVTITEYPW